MARITDVVFQAGEQRRVQCRVQMQKNRLGLRKKPVREIFSRDLGRH